MKSNRLVVFGFLVLSTCLLSLATVNAECVPWRSLNSDNWTQFCALQPTNISVPTTPPDANKLTEQAIERGRQTETQLDAGSKILGLSNEPAAQALGRAAGAAALVLSVGTDVGEAAKEANESAEAVEESKHSK